MTQSLYLVKYVRYKNPNVYLAETRECSQAALQLMEWYLRRNEILLSGVPLPSGTPAKFFGASQIFSVKFIFILKRSILTPPGAFCTPKYFFLLNPGCSQSFLWYI